MTEFITTALGEAGSGRARYGAAMALYQDAQISAAQLECFRIASADDGLDVGTVLAERSLPPVRHAAPSPEVLIRALIEESDAYLSRLEGPGVAEVRRGIARFRKRQYVARTSRGNAVVERHMAAALNASATTVPELAAIIAAAAPQLSWITYDLYDIGKIGEMFPSSHAFCSIMGEDGAVLADDFDLGLFLIAPDVLYRDHRHAAPELYAPLTGPHGWRFKPDAPLIIKQAHEPVWNEPHRPHLTKVGPTPFLCVYCWTRDVHFPAEVLPAHDWSALESLRL
jgi:hypothetical protein